MLLPPRGNISSAQKERPIRRSEPSRPDREIRLKREWRATRRLCPKANRAVSQIVPGWDSLIPAQSHELVYNEVDTTTASAPSTSENAVKLKACMPQIATNGSIRMTGKGGNAT